MVRPCCMDAVIDQTRWLRQLVLVRLVSEDAKLVSSDHDHVPFTHAAERQVASLVSLPVYSPRDAQASSPSIQNARMSALAGFVWLRNGPTELAGSLMKQSTTRSPNSWKVGGEVTR